MTLVVRGADTAEGSSIARGKFSHTEGDKSSATGAYAHAEGQSCVASNSYAHVEGDSSSASGQSSHAQGQNSTASAWCAHAEGLGSQATASVSRAEGRQAKATRDAQRAKASGQLNTYGDAQTSEMVLFGSTTTATAKVLTSGGVNPVYAGTTTNVYTLVADNAAMFNLAVVARRQGTDEVAAWTFRGAATRPNGGNARIVGTVATETFADAAAAAWAVTVTADTTNQFLKVTVTGEAAKTIGWVATLVVTEVVY